MSAIEVQPVGFACGARITGVDLSKPNSGWRRRFQRRSEAERGRPITDWSGAQKSQPSERS